MLFRLSRVVKEGYVARRPCRLPTGPVEPASQFAKGLLGLCLAEV